MADVATASPTPASPSATASTPPPPTDATSEPAAASSPSAAAAAGSDGRRGLKTKRSEASNFSPGGHYADPRSPIASTPLKRQRVQSSSKATPTPTKQRPATAEKEVAPRGSSRRLEDEYEAPPVAASDDHQQQEQQVQQPADGDDEPSGELFSPVLKPPRAASRASSDPSPASSTSAKLDANCLSSSSTCSERDDDDELSATKPVAHRRQEAGGGDDDDDGDDNEEDTMHSGGSDSASEASASDQEFNPFYFMKTLPKYDEFVLSPRPIALPAKSKNAPKICLVLDLDETLVHCSVDDVPDPHLQFPVNFNGVEYTVKVKKRPHMEYFLKRVSKLFEVVVFTASHRAYAETLLNLLDPHRNLIKYRLYRDDCLDVYGNYLKDLTVLGRDLSKVLLVDNSPHAFGYQVANGVPIETWYDDEGDDELLNLLPFLESLADADDVRPVVEKQFEIQKLIDATPDELV